jgi:nicotinamidase-related amidase
MAYEDALTRGELTETCAHICVDMQRLFAEKTDWFTPWMERVLPNARRLAEAHPDRTIFTRFVPLERSGQGRGTWRQYYERWDSMTLERLGPEMVELIPDLAALVPPAQVFDKHVYSPWLEGDLDGLLQRRGIDTLVVSGGETDVCVLGTILGAVDRGYRIVVATDGLCSSSDEAHDASLSLYQRRYGQQVETATTETILRHWRR